MCDGTAEAGLLEEVTAELEAETTTSGTERRKDRFKKRLGLGGANDL